MTEEHEALRVAAVLLAAGESSRMRESKALLLWRRGLCLVAYQATSLHEAGYEPIVVVLGHGSERIAEALPPDLPLALVVNPRYHQGRTTSIVVGLLHLLHARADAVLMASVDQPRTVATLRTLRETWERERPLIAVPSLGGRPGHPPLFDGELIPELLQVTEEGEGLRQVMRNFHDGRLLVPVDDPLTLTNLNTRDEYDAALRLVNASPAEDG